MERVRLLGLNHTTAPLELRERLAIAPGRHVEAVRELRSTVHGSEVVILSTCNRVELYLANSEPPGDVLPRFLERFQNVPRREFAGSLYERAGRDAVEHLFNVASSLDSMVLGETQILGQVRDAYHVARQAGATGPLLNPLFQRAVAVGKQVQHETGLGEGRLSIASVAVDYARGIFDHFDDKVVLCIGAGKMAKLVLRHFAALKPRKLIVCNRDPLRASRLASEVGGVGESLETLDEQLVAADVIVTSTGAVEPIVTTQRFEQLLRRRRYRPAFIIDLALPRDVEAGVGTLENVYLYNLDDLQRNVAATRHDRGAAVDTARSIVRRHVDEFAAALRQRQLGPSINALYSRYHAMASDELNRALASSPDVDAATRARLEEMARRIVNKVLHDPVEALKRGEAAHDAVSDRYLHALEKLFRLDQPHDRDEPTA